MNKLNDKIENSIIKEKNSATSSKINNIKRNVLISITTIILIMLAGIFICLNSSYKPQNIAKESLVNNTDISISIDNNVIFTPKKMYPTKGFIFYPGAKVDPLAYAPMCREIANHGYKVVIAKMPLNFAIFSPNKAQEIIDENKDIKTWVIGGHSLGGVMASKFASKNNIIKGIILLASYPQGDELKNLDKEVISIWGDNDRVLNFDNLEKSKLNLPADTQFIEIKGGNHGQFGDYGMQKGDNKASISIQEQTEISVKEIVSLLERLN